MAGFKGGASVGRGKDGREREERGREGREGEGEGIWNRAADWLRQALASWST